MPDKSLSRKEQAAPAQLRGVIDRFEGDLAAIVFDDDQKLDWPRRYLPDEAKPGDAVIVRLAGPSDQRWSGEWDQSGRINLSNGQSIAWPGQAGSGQVSLSIEIDSADTAARKERVRNLVDDIFKKRTSDWYPRIHANYTNKTTIVTTQVAS